MTTASQQRGSRTVSVVPDRPTGSLVARGVRNGLVAGLAMAMVVMVLGIFDQGFFAAPSAIWAFFAGPSAYAPTTLSVSFVLGAMGHMMNSAILAVVFGYVATRLLRLRGTAEAVVGGVVFALVVMAIMWNLVLPLGVNGDIVKDSSALWIWVIGHAAFGMVGGFLYAHWR